MRTILLVLTLCASLAGSELTVRGRLFELDGKPFPFFGISFFNAIYNAEFNRDSVTRRQWLKKFQKYGIRALRVWAQWDSKRGFVDTCPECSMYTESGDLRPRSIERLKQIATDADAEGMVIEFVLFSQESWHDGIRLGASADRAVSAVTRAMMPHRNVAFQIWNEFDERTIDHVKNIKSIDPKRIVSNSPGGAGVIFGMRGEEALLDYLSPHTSRQNSGKTWEIAPKELGVLMARYEKPVLDDEPARNGTPQFGGPKEATDPYDHIVHMAAVWRIGAYSIYHHDMFQMGLGHPSVPPSGIPDPEFSPYHRKALEFLGLRERYWRSPE